MRIEKNSDKCIAELLLITDNESIIDEMNRISRKYGITTNQIMKYIEKPELSMFTYEELEKYNSFMKLYKKQQIDVFRLCYHGMLSAYNAKDMTEDYLRKFMEDNNMSANTFRRNVKIYYDKYASFEEKLELKLAQKNKYYLVHFKSKNMVNFIDIMQKIINKEYDANSRIELLSKVDDKVFLSYFEDIKKFLIEFKEGIGPNDTEAYNILYKEILGCFRNEASQRNNLRMSLNHLTK